MLCRAAILLSIMQSGAIGDLATRDAGELAALSILYGKLIVVSMFHKNLLAQT